MAKLDIYCGLLGAGKTTVISLMLKTAYEGHRVAIIENEVGKVNLDAEELQRSSVGKLNLLLMIGQNIDRKVLEEELGKIDR